MGTGENSGKIARRGFLFKSLPALGATLALSSFQSVFSGSLNKLLLKFPTAAKVIRPAWNYEGLVLNTKTKTIHYPSAKIFGNYNQIAEEHLRVIPFKGWQNELKENHFIKSKSGLILEKLALRELSTESSDKTLTKATEVLALAFSKDYADSNQHNWRVYDLLMQLIVLNNSVKPESRWSLFSKIISTVNFQYIEIPKRNYWVTSQLTFSEKASYIDKNVSTYKQKLKNRITLLWPVLVVGPYF